MSHEHETSVHFRERPWHNLGTFKGNEDPPDNGRDMCVMSGCDWEIKEQPLFTSGQDRKAIKVPGYKLLTRSTDGAQLAVVKQGYEVFANTPFFEYFEPFLEQGMSFETGGSLKKGKVIFVLLRMGEFKIAGDAIETYLTGLNSHDGSISFTVSPTNVRVVCMNTVAAALVEVKGNLKNGRALSCRHTKSMAEKREQFRSALLYYNQNIEALKEEAKRLLQVKMSEQRYTGLVETLLPLPVGENVTERMVKTVEQKRSNLWKCISADDLENIRDRGWGAYQAVSDFAGHYGRQTERSRESRFLDMVQGHPLLIESRKLILAHN